MQIVSADSLFSSCLVLQDSFSLLVFYFLWLKKYQDGDGIVWPDGLEHHQQFDTAYATAALVVMLPEFSGAAAQLSPWLHVKCSGEKTHNIL